MKIEPAWIVLGLLVFVAIYSYARPKQVSKKNQVPSPQTQPGPTTSTTAPSEKKDSQNLAFIVCWIKKHPWLTVYTGIVGLVACIVLGYLFYKSSWVWDITILLGIWTIAKWLVDEKTFHKVEMTLGVCAFVILGVIPLNDWWTAPSSHDVIPLATAPLEEWPKLTIPPNGKSEMVTVPIGMRIMMSGDGFVNHTVYRNGTDCAYQTGVQCPNGQVIGNYAQNETQETNAVYYAFEFL